MRSNFWEAPFLWVQILGFCLCPQGFSLLMSRRVLWSSISVLQRPSLCLPVGFVRTRKNERKKKRRKAGQRPKYMVRNATQRQRNSQRERERERSLIIVSHALHVHVLDTPRFFFSFPFSSFPITGYREGSAHKFQAVNPSSVQQLRKPDPDGKVPPRYR